MRLSTLIRRQAGLNVLDRAPIEIVPGNEAPYVTGDSWHYETRGGRRIYHPSAYGKTGWSNMVYISSTRRVCVGLSWLLSKHFENCE